VIDKEVRISLSPFTWIGLGDPNQSQIERDTHITST
jgi:hypothetical protein